MKNICEYCGLEYEAKTMRSMYCSELCCREADKKHKRESYVGKRREKCEICGKELPKFKSKYCSEKCHSRAGAIKAGTVLDHGLLTKTCVFCGKEFQTFKSLKITCSDECSKAYKNKQSRKRTMTEEQKQRRKEHDHQIWLKSHPNALTAEERRVERKKERDKREDKRKKAQIEREAEWARKREEKERIRKENIAHWLEYEAEHKCDVCGESFIAHYPTAKYCSNKCSRAKRRDEEKFGGASVKIIARRYNDTCQLCGLKVDWTDKKELPDGSVICGKMYPSRDHIIPKSLGGSNDLDNLQLAHRMCNSRKGNRFIG